ncbi:MAG: hypothetical protein IPN99_00395 [Bacteroidetes bacterium]|nr:hypothetical protein [Bacteroidota bacterium]
MLEIRVFNNFKVIMNSRGRTPRNLTVYPLFKELEKQGYTFEQITKNLRIAPKRMKSVFQRPELLMLWQIERIGYLINKPLGYVLNLCTFSKSENPNWLNEDYNIKEHIEILKNRIN